MKVLAILRPSPGADVRNALARAADAELRTLWSLYREGAVREMYSPGGPGAVLILEAESRAAASARLSELPLLAGHTMKLELIELHPFQGLEILFGAPGP